MFEKSKFVINSDHFYLDPMLLWILCIRLVTWSVFNHVASIDANLLEQNKVLRTKNVQLPQYGFGTPTWPPFHFFEFQYGGRDVM